MTWHHTTIGDRDDKTTGVRKQIGNKIMTSICKNIYLLKTSKDYDTIGKAALDLCKVLYHFSMNWLCHSLVPFGAGYKNNAYVDEGVFILCNKEWAHQHVHIMKLLLGVETRAEKMHFYNHAKSFSTALKLGINIFL